MPLTRPSAFAKATADKSDTLSPSDGERIPRKTWRIQRMNRDIGRAALPRRRAERQLGPTGFMERAGARGGLWNAKARRTCNPAAAH